MKRVTLSVDGVRVAVDLPAAAVATIEHAVDVRKRAIKRQRDRIVASFLAENPNASANDAYRALGGNRQELLRAVRRARGAAAGDSPAPVAASSPTRFQGSGNHREDGDHEAGS